jgi:hypothetical protein
MKWLLTTLLSCAVLASATAQPPAGEAAKVTPTPYYPLQVGNTWTYRVGPEHRYQLKVTKHEKVGDVVCARIEMFVEGNPKSFELVGVTEDGVARYAFENKRLDPPFRFLKLPPKKGETWEVSSALGKTDKSAGEVIKATFKAGEEKVEVPAGKYDAITASTDDLVAAGDQMGVTYYFAKDVGLVKEVIEVAGQKVVHELEKFEPAKADKDKEKDKDKAEATKK